MTYKRKKSENTGSSDLTCKGMAAGGEQRREGGLGLSIPGESDLKPIRKSGQGNRTL